MWFKLLSFLFLAGCIWVGVEVYTEGTSGAFGGALSRLAPGGVEHTESATTLERVRSSASASRDRQLDRIEHQLGDESVGLIDRRTARAH